MNSNSFKESLPEGTGKQPAQFDVHLELIVQTFKTMTPKRQIEELERAIKDAAQALTDCDYDCISERLESTWLAARPLVLAAPELVEALRAAHSKLDGYAYAKGGIGYDLVEDAFQIITDILHKSQSPAIPPADPQLEAETCPDCKGTGEVLLEPVHAGTFYKRSVCLRCSGLGVVNTRAAKGAA